jgi:hypothetical protein
MSETRRLTPPWHIVETNETLRVEDANGIAIAYVYFTTDPERRSVTRYHSPEEARKIGISRSFG